MDKQVRQVSSSARSVRRSWPLLPVRRRGAFVEPRRPIATAVPTATTIPGRRVPHAPRRGRWLPAAAAQVLLQASAGMGNSRCSAEATSDPCTTTSVTATPASPSHRRVRWDATRVRSQVRAAGRIARALRSTRYPLARTEGQPDHYETRAVAGRRGERADRRRTATRPPETSAPEPTGAPTADLATGAPITALCRGLRTEPPVHPVSDASCCSARSDRARYFASCTH